MSNISYSTLGFVDREVEVALDGVAAAGFSQTEIMGQEPHLAVPPRERRWRTFDPAWRTGGCEPERFMLL